MFTDLQVKHVLHAYICMCIFNLHTYLHVQCHKSNTSDNVTHVFVSVVKLYEHHVNWL